MPEQRAKSMSGRAEAGVEESPNRILRQRAKELSQARFEEPARPSGGEVLDFVIAGDNYALPIEALREIAPLRRVAPVPGTPDFVIGVVMIRGQLVSVLDLRILLGLSSTHVVPGGSAIVLANDEMTFAFYADQVGEIRLLPDEELEAGKPSLERLDRRYIKGVTRDRALVIDGVKLLSDPRLVVNG